MVVRYLPIANIWDFSTSPAVSAFSPSSAILNALAPGMFPNITPSVVGLQHLDLLFESLFIFQVDVALLTK